MQQTTKYNLNLIERDDPFSPDALNENTLKVEQVLTTYQAGESAAREEAVNALDARLQVLEAKKIAFGSYSGGSARTFDLGFTPNVVFAFSRDLSNSSEGLALQGNPANYGNGTLLEIVENGFSVRLPTQNRSLCKSGVNYSYVALG